MRFLINRSLALTVFQQALKTCNVHSKGDSDSEFQFCKSDDPNQLTIKSINEFASQTLLLDLIEPIEEVESFSVDGQVVVEFLGLFPDEHVVCVYDKDKSLLVMGSKKSQYAFPTGEPENFVPFDYKKQGVEVDVSGDALANALKFTAFSTSTNYEDAPLTAVKVSLNGVCITAQSTDRTRASYVRVPSTDIGDINLDLLLPKQTAEILGSLLKEVNTVAITPGEKHIRFEWGDAIFVSRLEDASGKSFPNISKFFTGEELARVKVSRADLIRRLKLASINVKDSFLTVKVSADGFTLTAEDKFKGASSDVMVVQESSGESEMMVSCKNFTKAVETTDSPWVEISFTDLFNKPGTTVLVIIDGEYKHLMMAVEPQNANPEEKE